jgi:hypothetical protein
MATATIDTSEAMAKQMVIISLARHKASTQT